MAPSTVSARAATLALMAVAYATCEVASHLDGIPRPFGVAFGLGLLSLAVLAARFLKPRSPDQKPSFKLSLILGAILVAPLVLEPLLRELFQDGLPLELQLVNGLRILGLALAGLSAWTKFRRLAGVVALFLALFASAMGDQPAIPYLLAVFALVGGFWLVVENLASRQAVQAQFQGQLTDEVTLRLPYREAIVFGVLAIAAAGLVVAGPKRVLFKLGELMPTSGGTGATDLFARFGIGDGPEETAGDNAMSAGMVETDKMIEDNKNALIDAVNDTFGPPHKPRKDQERMVSAGLAQIIQNHGRLPENRRPSRDFDTSRQGPKSPKPPGSQGARGVFEVEGRTPLHVRLVVYEIYDGEEQRWLEARKPNSRLIEHEGNFWMAIQNLRQADWYSSDDQHRLKVADLKDNLVPTPTHTTRFRINKVDQPDYYEWDFEGVLALAGRKRTPPGTIVTTQCRTLNPNRLTVEAFATRAPQLKPQLYQIPDAERDGLRQLAEQWTQNVPAGWPQIQAILTKLKTSYTLDRAAAPPKDHPSSVRWFLTEAQRGADYHFATSAALLLRSLGYPTRVCLGYYATPEAYDRETAHTPVRASDLHLWPEVLLKDGHWLVIEPTPGYEVLPPLQTWQEWIVALLADLGRWVLRNILAIFATLAILIVIVWKRLVILDLVHTQYRSLFPGQTPSEILSRTVRLLERRAAWSGHPRPPAQSLRAWMNMYHEQPAVSQFVRWAERLTYSSASHREATSDELQRLCRQMLAEWPAKRFAQEFSREYS